MSTRVETAVEVLKGQIDARIASYFSSCVHCGICAEACLFYTETNDPRYTPIHKLEPMRRVWKQEYTFWGKLAAKLGLSKPLTEEDLANWEELVYDSCTMCGRCTMACPVGNDITMMIRKEREAMVASGYAPEGLQGATQRALEFGSPMGLTFKALSAQIKRLEAGSDLKVPVDVQGADYLALLSSMEVINFPEYIEALVRILKQAGVSWTLSSKTFEATNSGIQIGDSKVAAELVGRVVTAAEELGVKYVISPECGHAYTAIRWDGANLIGRPLPFQVVHILELLDQLREEGKLKLGEIGDERLTFHDPCQIVRRGGVVKPQRNLMKMVTSNFVEMPDHGVMNWCCGGGGGVSASERAEPLRLKVFDRKAKQIAEVKPDRLVTACANCRMMIEEGLEYEEMDMEVIGLTELLLERMEED